MLELAIRTVIACIASIFIAQFIKVFIPYKKSNEIDFKRFGDTGGMPSSHTATVTSLATSILIADGFSLLFLLSAVFAGITIRDAVGVRRSTGEQAKIINQIIKDLRISRKIELEKARVLLGHTPLQVAAGGVLGVFIAILVFWI